MRKPNKKCQWTDFCTTCDDIKDKQDTCYACEHYSMIDSGYGWCVFNPQPIPVAWCRDICSQFKSLVRL